MHIRRDKLESGMPLEGDRFLVSCTGLIVKDLEINCKILGCQAWHNGIVGCNAVAVALGLERLLEDKIAICAEGNQDVLVSRACPNWKATSVICVELAERVHPDKDLIGWLLHSTLECRRQIKRRRRHERFGLGWPNILVLLGQMPHDCLVGVGTVSYCIGVGEALEGVAVPSLDGLKPGLLDQEAQTSMVPFKNSKKFESKFIVSRNVY